MISLLLAASLAVSAPPPPTCDPPEPVPAGTQVSVVWLSPARATAAPWSTLTVIPTRTLRTWMAASGADVPRLLARLGRHPARRRVRAAWKAVVFEVEPGQLCRPTDAAPGGTVLAGLPVCPHGARRTPGQHDACGHAVDRVDDGVGPELLHVRWRDAASRGFVVLPLERFVRGQ